MPDELVDPQPPEVYGDPGFLLIPGQPYPPPPEETP